MDDTGGPRRIVGIGLSPDEAAHASSALDSPLAIVAPAQGADAMAAPDTELVIADLAAIEGLLPALLTARGDATLPPLLVLYPPEQAKQAEELTRSGHVHLLARTGDYLTWLPRFARQAHAAGRMVREQVSRLAARVAALAEEKHRLDCAVECMSEGLLVLDRDYRSATINPVARELLGVESLEELARKLYADAIDPGLHPIFWLEAHDEHAKPLRCWETLGCDKQRCPAYGSGLFPCWLYHGTLCQSNAPQAFPGKLDTCYQCRVYESNARVHDPARARGVREVAMERPVKKTLVSLSAPIVDDGGRFLGVVKLLRDVTTERLLEQVRNEFTSFITHELRTPLTSISGFLWLVLAGHAGELNDAQRRQLEVARRQAKRLEGLVDNLLDMSAIETGHLQLHPRRFDLVPLIVETVEMLRPQATARNVALRVVPGDDPVPVVADRSRIGQVLTNLVGNAIKYTDAGGQVTVTAASRDEDASVEVADTGRGIPPEEIPRLFDKYYRVSSRAGGTRGSGLGLAICDGIIDAHGGRLGVKSTPGKGSCFFFTIPPPEHQPPPASQP